MCTMDCLTLENGYKGVMTVTECTQCMYCLSLENGLKGVMTVTECTQCTVSPWRMDIRG